MTAIDVGDLALGIVLGVILALLVSLIWGDNHR